MTSGHSLFLDDISVACDTFLFKNKINDYKKYKHYLFLNSNLNQVLAILLISSKENIPV